MEHDIYSSQRIAVLSELRSSAIRIEIPDLADLTWLVGSIWDPAHSDRGDRRRLPTSRLCRTQNNPNCSAFVEIAGSTRLRADRLIAREHSAGQRREHSAQLIATSSRDRDS